MKTISCILCLSLGLLCSDPLYGQDIKPLAAVVMAGGIIKAQHGDGVTKKYNRKDCPVCDGKGWYISGDKISKVDCGYCEPNKPKAGLEPLNPPNINKTRVYRK